MCVCSLFLLLLSFVSLDVLPSFSLDGKGCNGRHKVLGYEVYLNEKLFCTVEGALTSQAEILGMEDGKDYAIQVWYANILDVNSCQNLTLFFFSLVCYLALRVRSAILLRMFQCFTGNCYIAMPIKIVSSLMVRLIYSDMIW